jgi:hypothetical protein
MHATIDELIDIAEGASLEASAPHLAECERCRAQLSDLRAAMSAAKEVEVPEPSPLFWNHLSARVSEAVAAEPRASQTWGLTPYIYIRDRAVGRLSRWTMAGVALAAGLLIAVATSSRAPLRPSPAAPAAFGSDARAVNDLLGDAIADDDPSLTVVASLTDDQDLDTVRAAGLATRGSAEHAVALMSDDELRELGRLLKEELTRSGA